MHCGDPQCTANEIPHSWARIKGTLKCSIQFIPKHAVNVMAHAEKNAYILCTWFGALSADLFPWRFTKAHKYDCASTDPFTVCGHSRREHARNMSAQNSTYRAIEEITDLPPSQLMDSHTVAHSGIQGQERHTAGRFQQYAFHKRTRTTSSQTNVLNHSPCHMPTGNQEHYNNSVFPLFLRDPVLQRCLQAS